MTRTCYDAIMSALLQIIPYCVFDADTVLACLHQTTLCAQIANKESITCIITKRVPSVCPVSTVEPG